MINVFVSFWCRDAIFLIPECFIPDGGGKKTVNNYGMVSSKLRRYFTVNRLLSSLSFAETKRRNILQSYEHQLHHKPRKSVIRHLKSCTQMAKHYCLPVYRLLLLLLLLLLVVVVVFVVVGTLARFRTMASPSSWLRDN